LAGVLAVEGAGDGVAGDGVLVAVGEPVDPAHAPATRSRDASAVTS
jgi:class 3 adenylate cyclase